jgi:voltage-gated potassium channel
MRLTQEQKQVLHPLNIIVFFLSIYVIVATIVIYTVPLDQEVRVLLRDIDHGVCVVFFIDFLYRFFTAKSKRKYMRWGWIDFISSIPMDALVVGRIFRIFQLLRVVRAIRELRLMSAYFFKNRIKSAFASAAIFAFLMIIFCAVAMLQVEHDAPGSHIKTAEDALWWAYVTITTVGYGDVVPVTREGRMIAAVLMTVGVGLFGTFTAYVASWFVEQKEEEREAEKEEEQLKEERERAKEEAVLKQGRKKVQNELKDYQ